MRRKTQSKNEYPVSALKEDLEEGTVTLSKGIREGFIRKGLEREEKFEGGQS